MELDLKSLQDNIILLEASIDASKEEIAKLTGKDKELEEKNLLELKLEEIENQIALLIFKQKKICDLLKILQEEIKNNESKKGKNTRTSKQMINMFDLANLKIIKLMKQYLALGQEYFYLGEVLKPEKLDKFSNMLSKIKLKKADGLSSELQVLIEYYNLKRIELYDTMVNVQKNDGDSSLISDEIDKLNESILSLLNFTEINEKILDIELLKLKIEICSKKRRKSVEESDELDGQIMQLTSEYFARTGKIILPFSNETQGIQKKLS